MKTMKKILFLLLFAALLSACNNKEEEKATTPENTEEKVATPENTESEPIEFQTIDTTNLPKDKIVAVYDGGKVTGEEFVQYLSVQAFLNPYARVNEQEFRKQMLNDFILERIAAKQVEVQDSSKVEVDAAWEQITQSYDETSLKNAYSTLNIDEKMVKQALTSFLHVNDFIKAQITEKDLKEFYETSKENYSKVTFRHLLIGINEDGSIEQLEKRTAKEAEQIAQEVYTKLKEGASMAELVKEFSDDANSIEQEGRYPNVLFGSLDDEFKSVIRELEPNTFSEPIKTSFGYHIIQLENIFVSTFDEVKDQLVTEVVQKNYLDYLFDELPKQIKEINL